MSLMKKCLDVINKTIRAMCAVYPCTDGSPESPARCHECPLGGLKKQIDMEAEECR